MKRLGMLLPLLCVSLAQTALGAAYDIPADGSDVVGEISVTTATFDDTLLDIARRHGVGYQDIVRANPDVNVWVPGDGTDIVLPTQFVLPPGPREGIVLNLAEYRLYYFPKPAAGETAKVITYPISIGRQDWETPIGVTKIVAKAVNPSWYPPQSVREEHAAEGRPLASVVPPGPDNPLGRHAMRLGLPGYLIHGTNKPAGVGMRVTHGCLRMFPEDIESLFDLVSVNTQVRIINEPVKIGWRGEELVMEVHPLLETGPVDTRDEPVRTDENNTDIVDDVPDVIARSDDELADDVAPGVEPVIEPAEKSPLTYVTERFIAATSERAGALDWLLAEEVVRRSDGMPVVVGTEIKNAATSAAFE